MTTLTNNLRPASREIIKRLGLITCLVALFALPPVGFCQGAREQVIQEIAKTSNALESVKSSSDEWKQFKPDLANLLARARQAAEAGRLYSALELLGATKVNLA